MRAVPPAAQRVHTDSLVLVILTGGQRQGAVKPGTIYCNGHEIHNGYQCEGAPVEGIHHCHWTIGQSAARFKLVTHGTFR